MGRHAAGAMGPIEIEREIGELEFRRVDGERPFERDMLIEGQGHRQMRERNERRARAHRSELELAAGVRLASAGGHAVEIERGGTGRRRGMERQRDGPGAIDGTDPACDMQLVALEAGVGRAQDRAVRHRRQVEIEMVEPVGPPAIPIGEAAVGHPDMADRDREFAGGRRRCRGALGLGLG
jgi:hypothetical protein